MLWPEVLRQNWGSAMAKKARKKTAAKAAKTKKASSKSKAAKVTSAKTKRIKTQTAKTQVAKTQIAKPKGAAANKPRKVAAPPPSKPVAKKKPAAQKVQKSFLRTVEDKVAGAFNAVINTLVDAEQLHHKLDPGVSPEPE
jgi:hypothetical protein